MLVSRGRNPSAGEIISQLIQAKALRELLADVEYRPPHDEL